MTNPPVEAQPVVHLDETNFNTFTLKIPNVVVDLWAEWCGPCRYFAPIFEETAKEYPEVQFCKCNTDENKWIAQELQINSIPTIMYIHKTERFRKSGLAQSVRRSLEKS
jgi:thioredoxin